MSEKLKMKDLVTIGIFAVIYVVVFYIVGMMGFIPILFMIYPFVSGIVGGTIVLLFMAKVPKPWALFIFGMIAPLIMFAMGHTFVVPLAALVFVGLAEFFFRKGGFKSFKFNAIAYGFFSCWIPGSLMQMLLVHDKFKQLYIDGGSTLEYFEKLESLISWPSLALVAVGAFLGGVIGAFIGKAMLKKHFEKAGIV